MYIKGTARVDRRTKDLAKRLQPSEIAIINHIDLDEVAAASLIEKKVKAVINAAPSISGKYPNLGPLALAEAGVYLLDEVGEEVMGLVQDGSEIELVENKIFYQGSLIAEGEILTLAAVKEKMEETKANLPEVLEKFVQNTLQYAQKEQNMILGNLKIPNTSINFPGRHTLIVVRGQNYKEDLAAVSSYIEEVKPVLIGVDGGADALIEFGHKPDIIIGDMDSIKDSTLKCGSELIVHAYSDGRAPGLERVSKLGLKALTFPAPGTSEDVAMLLAYEKGTELIVAVGTHSNMIDFLEKGRKGMASTFLVRLKVGSILVDAKGVNKLYKRRVKFRYLAGIVAAALIPFLAVAFISPATRQFIRVVFLLIKNSFIGLF